MYPKFHAIIIPNKVNSCNTPWVCASRV
jgi:hypothetical protein